MAAVIRVKRRRNEDPAEALLLSQKKSRLDSAASSESKIDSVLEFAGTLSSKNEPVATHIKEAIKKRKLHKQLHPLSADSKPTSELIDKVRAQNTHISQNNRYRIICSRRAFDIDRLDSSNTPDEASINNSSVTCDSDSKKECIESKDSIGNNGASSEPADVKAVAKDGVDNDGDSVQLNPKISKDSEAGDPEVSNGFADKLFCLLDVENQEEQADQASASGITMNNVPMLSKTPVPVEEESDDYVYDLYYAHAGLRESHLEDILVVESLCNELVCAEHGVSDEEEVDDIDEDSNDESNWRNDYPDEDPGFYDNEGQDYGYENDMRQRNFGGSDDEGDLLSYWMDTRCRIDVDCADFADDDKDTDEGSSDEYKEDDN